MRIQRGWAIWFVSGVAVLCALCLPRAASAAAPRCAADASLYELPAGLTWLNPRAPCTDADGDAITIEVVDPPKFGTLNPDGAQPIGVERWYTANPDAAGNRDSMKFVAVANGERSNEFQTDVWILPAHGAPVCNDVRLNVQAGSSVAVMPSCVDPDHDAFTFSARSAPKHGTFDPANGTYTAARRFAGRDKMTYVVVDAWRLVSAVRTVTITVKPAPGARTMLRDRTAPRLTLRSRSRSITAARRAIRLTVTSNEPGRMVMEAHVSDKIARRLGIDTRVGSLARDLAAGKTTVKLRLYRDVRAELANLRRVRLSLVARMVDAAGNVRTKHMHITLRRK
jgi:hypothetical protein